MRFLDRHDKVVVGDSVFGFRNDFHVYLKVQEILSAQDIFDEDKVETICGILFFEKIPPQLRVEAVASFLRLYSDDKPTTGQKCIDMKQDAQLIYAGFMQMYGIDLDSAELSIEQFLALFAGFSADTRLREVVKIRTMPLPKPTKGNEAQRSAIMKAKREVALQGEDSLKSGLASFGKMIRSMAKNG